MQNLHFKLTSKYPKYNNWHQTKHHNKIHWGVLILYSLFIFSLIINPFGFDTNNKLNTSSTKAQTTLEIPLSIEEPAGIPRTNEPITSGIPLPPGNDSQYSRWSLWDGAQEIPLQVTKLQGRTPWILLDFQTSVPANGIKTLTLKETPSQLSPQKPISITEDANQITVITGPLKTLINKTQFNLFDAVWLDKDNDNNFTNTEQVITSIGDNIQIVDVTTNQTFSGRGTPDKISWEYQGPIRSTLRIDGKYKNGTTEFISYTTRLTFYAGRSDIKIEHILRNSYQPNERHVKIQSAIVKIGSGATSVRATRPGSISWANVDTGGASFELVPAMLWNIDTATNNGMVLPDWSYHGATLIADFSEGLSSPEQTRFTNASKSPLFAMASPSWYSEYGELSASKFSTLQDEKDAYTKWGWTWTASDEPVDQLATGPGKTIPDYAVSWRDVSVHGDTESDDLWQHNLMYLRTGQRSYWDRAVAWARYRKWEYAFRTDGFDYAWNGNFESPPVSRPEIAIPLTSADSSYLDRIYKVDASGGRVDVLAWGADHFWGWGLIDYYYFTGDQDALEAAEDLGEISERVFGWRTPGSYTMGRGRMRRGSRHLLFATRLYEATQTNRWQNHMEHLAKLWLQSSDWDLRGMYGVNEISSFMVDLVSHALDRYYQLTHNTLAKDRLIAIAQWTKQYALHSTYLYSGSWMRMDDPNPGDIWHKYFDDGNLASFDPTYTVSFVDTLVRGYRLTGDISFLARAKLHWDRGSKGVRGDVTRRTAGDNEVGRFMNDGFLHSGIWRYYSENKGDLSYVHLLFYDYTHLGDSPDTTPPTTPTNLIATVVSSSQINLSWTASTDNVAVTGYRVYRNGIQIATTSIISYQDTGLQPSTLYTYTVTAYDAAGNVSAQSIPASVTTTQAQPPENTSLALLAAQMPPKTWAVLNTSGDGSGFGRSLLDAGKGHHILEYASKATWDANSRQLLFIGKGHYADQKFITYSDATNTWKEEPKPYWDCGSTCAGHGYEHNTLNPSTGDFYHRRYNSTNVYEYTRETESWSELPQVPRNVMSSVTCCMGLEYFPELGGLILVGGGSVYFFDEATAQWSRLTSGLPMGPYHNFALYNPNHKVVLFGGGNESSDVYKIDASGNITKLKNAPIELGVVRSINTVDSVSGKYLVFGSNQSFYEYDVSTDTWILQDGIPPIFTRSSVFGIIATPVSTYGVMMFVKWDYDESKVYLYKHSSSSMPPPLDFEPPTVSVTSPSSGQTVSGTFTVSATASDNIGVVGVQFRLDGTNLGAEDTTAPYATNWDATTIANGTHTLTAVARDAAGNTTTSSVVTVSVNNAVADSTPPSLPTGLIATAVSSSQINLSWTASTDNVGVAGYKIYRCAGSGCAPTIQISTSTTNSYSDTGLIASTAYTYTVSAYDAAGNESAKSSSVSATTLAGFKPSDLNQDTKVDQQDFDILKQDWKRTDKPKSDLNQDGIVNSQDLGIMMSEWTR